MREQQTGEKEDEGKTKTKEEEEGLINQKTTATKGPQTLSLVRQTFFEKKRITETLLK